MLAYRALYYLLPLALAIAVYFMLEGTAGAALREGDGTQNWPRT